MAENIYILGITYLENAVSFLSFFFSLLGSSLVSSTSLFEVISNLAAYLSSCL